MRSRSSAVMGARYSDPPVLAEGARWGVRFRPLARGEPGDVDTSRRQIFVAH